VSGRLRAAVRRLDGYDPRMFAETSLMTVLVVLAIVLALLGIIYLVRRL
jgi:flagellar biogenesis protein FliO